MSSPPQHYILNVAGEPERCDDILRWAAWFETADRTVAKDRDEHPLAPDILISTIFLGLDHNYYSDGPPVLWETLVFGGPLDGEMQRYTSREEALVGHQEVCERVTLALQIDRI